MNTKISKQFSSINSIAFIGNYLPRHCGIATFTTHLVNAVSDTFPSTDCWTMAMNDQQHRYKYPDVVRFELNQNNLKDYSLAADFLNINQPDVICIQHEFGIFGGAAGSNLLKLMQEARVPIVTTLHTVLTDPPSDYRHVMLKIAERSDRLVVMSHKAVDILRDVYDIPAKKIAFIPHGIPDIPFVDPNYYKEQFGVMGKKVLLTFGLLSQNKGIEYAIKALPQVVEKFPDIVYIVLGATHPNIVRDEGEHYRLQLQNLVRQLKLEQHVIFHNRFVTQEELCEYLAAADIYITPYIGEAQITSGTLAYAMGTGKPVISTPYWYAEEMLADGRGTLVPFKDASAISHGILQYLENEELRHQTRKKAYDFTRSARWREVATSYMEVFNDTICSLSREPKPQRNQFSVDTRSAQLTQLPEICFNHLFALSDDTGILQHAKYTIAHRSHGYCTDDNARALMVTAEALHNNFVHTEQCRKLTDTYLSFLGHAFNEENGYFRNFMSYERTWLEDAGSEDAHGRAIWALGKAVSLFGGARQQPFASYLFKRGLEVTERFTSLRGIAFTLLGCSAYLRVFSGDSEVRRLLEKLSDTLFSAFSFVKDSATDWCWPENTLTYDNARLCQSLIECGQTLERSDMIEVGLNALDWLMALQFEKDVFVPIGCNGWYERNAERARFDQQPLEACASLQACLLAYTVTKQTQWRDCAVNTFNWYLGNNDLNIPLYDAKTGGCYDGLESHGVNLNQGAESTLSWLQSLVAMHISHAEDNLTEQSKDSSEKAVLL
ncbi:glycosyltransferase family 4 protein [Alteromonas sp. 14N.309.X.WAT.G.H12]|uniref:glycosyltransferase family 4 protein n=1 Tax=Alteromonas sp. 14N.309.X.WAT.G.H12 TaxID=3120824 RepID=UPI002FD42930